MIWLLIVGAALVVGVRFAMRVRAASADIDRVLDNIRVAKTAGAATGASTGTHPSK